MQDNKITLVIMAAGMGSRFGGLKQIEAIGPTGEFITDYSIYDALLAGVNKVVWIIKKENLEIFQNTIGKRIANKVPMEYVFQEDTIEWKGKKYKREKPWGTAHAILAAKKQVDGNFIVINADDFYGRESYQDAVEFFKTPRKNTEFALMGYVVKNTLTKYGAVKRGVCQIKNNYLESIIECSVEAENKKIIAKPLTGSKSFQIEDNTVVCMNMLLFTPYIFTLIEENMGNFLEENRDNLDTCEYFIPEVMQKKITEGKITVQVLNTIAKWEGITYKEDKENMIQTIHSKIAKGDYKEDLWQDK